MEAEYMWQAVLPFLFHIMAPLFGCRCNVSLPSEAGIQQLYTQLSHMFYCCTVPSGWSAARQSAAALMWSPAVTLRVEMWHAINSPAQEKEYMFAYTSDLLLYLCLSDQSPELQTCKALQVPPTPDWQGDTHALFNSVPVFAWLHLNYS